MPLVFRKNQTGPLTNEQVDGNFQYLVDQINLKYSTSDFNAAQISLKLRTPTPGVVTTEQLQGTLSASTNSTTITGSQTNFTTSLKVNDSVVISGTTVSVVQINSDTSIVVNNPISVGANTPIYRIIPLNESNAINAWTLRSLYPSSTLPSVANKESVVVRDSNGDIAVGTITGNLIGNASSATLASNATKLATARQINGVNFDGSASITITDSSKLPLAGGILSGKLNVAVADAVNASINIPVSSVTPGDIAKVNGDIWVTTAGIFFHNNNTTNQLATTVSPTFTGVPTAPTAVASTNTTQLATTAFVNNAVTNLNNTITTSINLKANIASPAFTGVPTAPTAVANTNTTQIATTAFVNSSVSTSHADSTNYTNAAVSQLSNTINVALNTKANIASPAFTGVPTAPTPSLGTNNTQIATTAFTKSEIESLKSLINGDLSVLRDLINATRPVPSGAVFFIASSVVPYGYLECNGQWVDKNSYQDLWAALGSPPLGTLANIGKFKLPDLRGEFIRGWDHGRGMDPGRQLGSWQIGSLHLHNDESDSYTGGVWNNMWTDGIGYSHVNDAANPYGNGHANELGYDAMTFEWLGEYADTMTRGNMSSNSAAYAGSGQEWRDGTINLNPNATYRSNHWIFMGRPRNVALMPIIKW